MHAGADSLGLNFSQTSQRNVDVETAAEISSHVRGALQRVGLFVNASAADVEAVLGRVELDVLQFHGDETGAYCERFGIPFMKAIRMRAALDVEALEDEYHAACCLLLDAYVPGETGGTGTRFDLQFWPEQASKPLVLAGGLTPDNVAEAIRRVRPYAVDVSGGVEGRVKGEKDRGRIMQFVKEVKSV